MTAKCVVDSDCTDLAPGLSCDEDTGACLRPRAVGQSCKSVACAPGLYCTTGTSPTCQLRRKKGDACSTDAQCSSRFSLYCVGGVCTDNIRSTGASCASGANGFLCAADGECEGTTPGKCTLPLADGAACDEGSWPFFATDNCRYPATCVQGKCSAKYDCAP